MIVDSHTRDLLLRTPWALLLAAWLGVIGCGPAGESRVEAGRTTGKESPDRPVGEGATALGEGFVVWESNRTGDWRIWYRMLDGSGLRQLVPDEQGRQHCCPHIAPDGARLVYLSQTGDWDEYPEKGTSGELRLRSLDSGQERVLVESARTYDWGNRAAVWRNDRELIYVGAEGRTHLVDLESGTSRALTRERRAEFGWLVDPTLSYAITGKPSFSVYEPESRRVLPRQELGGCEPYFSHDGRWGYWVTGAGGPIDRIDLATRKIATLVEKNDARLGAQGYLYFPMLSRDGRLLAFGASAGGHNHFESDYDIFAFPVDPDRFEVSGPPIRLTDSPATDRYPDVFLSPAPLGRHRGEAPFRVEISPPPGLAGPVVWDWGDGSRDRGPSGRHLYEEPGTYPVVARRAEDDGTGERELRGLVVVEEPRAPRIVEQELRNGGREIRVGFDEPVTLGEGFAASLDSGTTISGSRLRSGGRVLVLELSEALGSGDRLSLRGVRDRAQRPNRMADTTVEIEPPTWPATRGGLVFQWRTGNSPNLVPDPELGAERAVSLEAQGRARLDHHYRMRLGDGAFVAPPEASRRLLRAVSASNELTIEATLVPEEATTDGLRRIVTFSSGMGKRNFTLGQVGRSVAVRLRTGRTGANADRPQVLLFDLTPGEPVHVAVTYSPGRLRAYRNGELVQESRAIQGSFGMHWSFRRLLFGREWGGGAQWPGILEGVALYSRALPPELVRESWLRYRRILESRSPVPRTEVRARLLERSEIPTLADISPYRRALAVYSYAVAETLDGPELPDRIRVARWVILDGETLPEARLSPGQTEELTLEPFADNLQLEDVFLSETLEETPGPLWYAMEP